MPPFAIRARKLLEEHELTFKTVEPAFSYRILDISTPTWAIHPLTMKFELIGTCNAVLRQLFRDVWREKYGAMELVFTDGSKNEDGVGAGVVWRRGARSEILPCDASVYTAELYAIFLARLIIKKNPSKKFVIFSDSFLR